MSETVLSPAPGQTVVRVDDGHKREEVAREVLREQAANFRSEVRDFKDVSVQAERLTRDQMLEVAGLRREFSEKQAADTRLLHETILREGMATRDLLQKQEIDRLKESVARAERNADCEKDRALRAEAKAESLGVTLASYYTKGVAPVSP